MSICKIWPIKAHIDKKNKLTPANIMKGIKASQDYVEDEEKTNGQYPPDADSNNIPFQGDEKYDDFSLEQEIDYVNTQENFQSVIDYMVNEHKTKKTYVSGYLCDPDFLVEQWMQTKQTNLQRVGKQLEDDLGNQGYHMVQSFPDDLPISDEEVHQCGLELCKKLGIHQALVASHLHPVYDENGVLRGKCKHNHILINSHINPEFVDPNNPEKMKYNDCKETYAQLREWNDEISIEHGFPVILESDSRQNYSWYANEMENQGKSWKQRIRVDIENAMKLSNNWTEYENLMKEAGYTIKQGKHETYQAPDHSHKARGSTLGKEYTKDYLEEYWQLKRELNQIVSEEKEQRQEQTISYTNLKALLQSPQEEFFTTIPRINKRTKKPYTFKFPINTTQEEQTINAYIHDKTIYPLYQGKNKKLGRISGKDLKDILLNREHDSYEEQKAWEEAETKRQEQEDINLLLKKSKKETEFSIDGWNNSKTNIPYQIGLYDENGRERSLIEHILILAVVVISNEIPEFAIPEYQREQIKKRDATAALILAEPSWKIEKILEAIKYTKEENIKDLDDLKQKINNTGKEYQKLNTQKSKNAAVRKKMFPIQAALTNYENLKDFCESIYQMPNATEQAQKIKENKQTFDIYNAAKATLYHYKLDTEEKKEDFKKRWEFNTKEEERLQLAIAQTANKYKKLKKIKYQVDLALNKNYCFSTGETINKYRPKDKRQNEKQSEKQAEKQNEKA